MNTPTVEIIGSGDTPTEERFAVGNDEVMSIIVTQLKSMLTHGPKEDKNWSEERQAQIESELEKMSARTDQQIIDKIGIVSRQYRRDKTSYELALIAVNGAIESAQTADPNFALNKVALVAFGSSTPDHVYPGGDAYIHEQLGLGGCVEGINVASACCSFMEAMACAYRAMMLDPDKEYAIISAGEVAGTAGNAFENEDATLWGDGGAAFVLRANRNSEPGTGILATYCRLYTGDYENKGRMYDMTLSEGQGAHPQHRGWRLNGSMCGYGHEIYEIVRRVLPKDGRAWLDEKGYLLDDSDELYPHNGSLGMIQKHGKFLGYQPEQIHNRIADRGNQSSVSSPSTYAFEAVCGNVKSGQRLLFDVFGSGLKHMMIPYRVP